MTNRKEHTAAPRKQPSLKKKTLKDLEPHASATNKARGGLSSIKGRVHTLSRTASFSKG